MLYTPFIPVGGGGVGGGGGGSFDLGILTKKGERRGPPGHPHGKRSRGCKQSGCVRCFRVDGPGDSRSPMCATRPAAAATRRRRAYRDVAVDDQQLLPRHVKLATELVGLPVYDSESLVVWVKD